MYEDEDRGLRGLVDIILHAAKFLGVEVADVTIRYLPLGQREFKDVKSFNELIELKPPTEIVITFKELRHPPDIERPVEIKAYGEVSGPRKTAYFIRIVGLDVSECKYGHEEYVEGEVRGLAKKTLDFIKEHRMEMIALIDLGVNMAGLFKAIMDD
jgi:hypothetical protein